MVVEKTEIEGLLIITPKKFEDDRGSFCESYNSESFTRATGLSTVFSQDNQSISKTGVLRGMHFQVPPHAQSKLVRVVRGMVQDVAVDLRKSSPTYGRYFSLLLSGENGKMLYIPEGFAHGFLTLEDETIFCYKCSELYHPESDRSLLWNDSDLAISWQLEHPTLSLKDANAPLFRDFESPF
jgi:dTDP-4-dehydrorhamnose 3,5-epimerase